MKRKQAASLPKSMQLFITIGLSLIAAVATAIGCSWPGTSHSVRFNAYQTEREMGRLPPLPTMANGMNEARAYWDIEEEPVEDDSVYVDPAKEVDGLWDRAEAAEKDINKGYVYVSWATVNYFREQYADAWAMVKRAREAGGQLSPQFLRALNSKMREP